MCGSRTDRTRSGIEINRGGVLVIEKEVKKNMIKHLIKTAYYKLVRLASYRVLTCRYRDNAMEGVSHYRDGPRTERNRCIRVSMSGHRRGMEGHRKGDPYLGEGSVSSLAGWRRERW